MKKHKPAAPPLTGLINCPKGHQWDAVNINPERVTTNCPVCGRVTDILQGMGKKDESRKQRISSSTILKTAGNAENPGPVSPREN